MAMDIAPFELERWFAEVEADADIMLAESGIRSLPADRFDLDVGPLDYVIPTNGDPALRRQVGDHYDRPADEVLLTCGTQEANLLAFLATLDPTDHAVVITPTYQSLVSLPATLASVTTVSLSPPTWELSIDAVFDAMEPETRLIVLANPNNPTGRCLDCNVIAALLDIAIDHDAHLLCDEVYRLLADDPLAPVASLHDSALSTAGLTKAYGLAGLRFGWLVGPEHIVERAWHWKDYTTISPPRIAQHIATQLFEDDLGETILVENRDLAARNRSIVAAFIDRYELGWSEPVGVNAFVQVPSHFDSGRAFCRQVVDEVSVVLAPGEAFGVSGYVRLGFGLETNRLREGLNRVGQVIKATAPTP